MFVAVRQYFGPHLFNCIMLITLSWIATHSCLNPKRWSKKQQNAHEFGNSFEIVFFWLIWRKSWLTKQINTMNPRILYEFLDCICKRLDGRNVVTVKCKHKWIKNCRMYNMWLRFFFKTHRKMMSAAFRYKFFRWNCQKVYFSGCSCKDAKIGEIKASRKMLLLWILKYFAGMDVVVVVIYFVIFKKK